MCVYVNETSQSKHLWDVCLGGEKKKYLFTKIRDKVVFLVCG